MLQLNHILIHETLQLLNIACYQSIIFIFTLIFIIFIKLPNHIESQFLQFLEFSFTFQVHRYHINLQYQNTIKNTRRRDIIKLNDRLGFVHIFRCPFSGCRYIRPHQHRHFIFPGYTASWNSQESNTFNEVGNFLFRVFGEFISVGNFSFVKRHVSSFTNPRYSIGVRVYMKPPIDKTNNNHGVCMKMKEVAGQNKSIDNVVVVIRENSIPWNTFLFLNYFIVFIFFVIIDNI